MVAVMIAVMKSQRLSKILITTSQIVQVASAEFDRQGQEYDEERLIDQITETLKARSYMLCAYFQRF